jgi:hypothetical protein
MGGALAAFLEAQSDYADLALPLVELLRTAQASLTVADPK